jgi:hypothetical protein
MTIVSEWPSISRKAHSRLWSGGDDALGAELIGTSKKLI